MSALKLSGMQTILFHLGVNDPDKIYTKFGYFFDVLFGKFCWSCKSIETSVDMQQQCVVALSFSINIKQDNPK